MENLEKKDVFMEDPRYKQCNKEALLGLGLGILNLIWWFVTGYGLGSGSPEEYSYILGFPTWFFMSSVLGGIIFTILAIIMVLKFYKDMPLERMTVEEATAYLEEVNKA